MPTEFKLPEVGEGVKSADIAEILVKEGDTITSGQIVAEIETEKAVAEVPCNIAGRVAKIHVKQGDTLEVGGTLLTIEETNGAAQGNSGQPSSSTEKTSQRETQTASNSKGSANAPMAEAAPSVASSQSSEGGGSVEFKLPEVGEGVKSADVAEVLVKEGDTITVGQVVAEIETEKAVAEVPSSVAGKITKVHVKQGDTLEVGGVLLTVQTGATTQTKASSEPRTSTSATPSKQASPNADVAPQPAGGETHFAQPDQTAVTAKKAAESDLGKERPPAPASPSTRRLARELGVDLYLVKGSGPGGRITTEDVQAFVKAILTKPSKAATSSGSGPMAPPPLPDFTKFGTVEREPLNKIGKTAAQHLTMSWNVIPHVTQHELVDITEIEAARRMFLAGRGKDGPKVTMTAIAIKCVVTALKAFPKFNASLDPETMEIVYKKYFNIGVAVDTPNGLVVPVIKHVDKKTILHIADELTALAGKARDRKLTMDDMQGANFTITNLGGIGGTYFTPIVSYPEVAILGMSRGTKQLVMVNGQPQERLMLPLSLSYDHRVINGADAARFIVKLSTLMSDQFTLIAEQ